MEIPIACTLEPDEARSQLGEWQRLLRHAVQRAERASPNRLELSLAPDAEVASVVRLAHREAACCPFFSFAIATRADRLVLVVEVPATAIEILDELASEVSEVSEVSGPRSVEGAPGTHS
ncbi:MAG: hypothetical protein ABSF33_15535 [Acidimicrobiales bacterium]